VRRRADDETGLSLIELIIATVVLAIGGVAVVLAMGTTSTTSSVHRSLAGGEVVLRDFGEAIVAAFDKPAAPDQPQAVPCPTVGSLDLAVPDSWGSGTDLYRASVTGIEYWIPSSANPQQGSWGGPTECNSAHAARCASGATFPACDAGVVRVAMLVEPDGKSGAADTDQTGRVVARRSP
jgi:type II secretory pathway pseudopilin PulG